MPIMDGFEATSIIKNEDDLKSVPVIALTASAMKEERDKILYSGFDHFLPKPIFQKELVKKLSNYLNYKTSAPKHSSSATEEISYNLNNMSGEQIKELLGILEGNLKQKWELIRTTFILNEIESFAKEIIKTGVQFNANNLIDWGEKLIEQTQNSDMENLPSSINQYKKIIPKFKNLKFREGKHNG